MPDRSKSVPDTEQVVPIGDPVYRRISALEKSVETLSKGTFKYLRSIDENMVTKTHLDTRLSDMSSNIQLQIAFAIDKSISELTALLVPEIAVARKTQETQESLTKENVQLKAENQSMSAAISAVKKDLSEQEEEVTETRHRVTRVETAVFSKENAKPLAVGGGLGVGGVLLAVAIKLLTDWVSKP